MSDNEDEYLFIHKREKPNELVHVPNYINPETIREDIAPNHEISSGSFEGFLRSKLPKLFLPKKTVKKKSIPSFVSGSEFKSADEVIFLTCKLLSCFRFYLIFFVKFILISCVFHVVKFETFIPT